MNGVTLALPWQGNVEGFIWLTDVYLWGSLCFAMVSTFSMLIAAKGAPYFFASGTVCEYVMTIASVATMSACSLWVAQVPDL